jgi:geranylgeranyl reductase family protein
MRRSKIIVVGAGPAGGACALTLARAGRADVTVLDKSSYPRVKVCGSGLSPHALQVIDTLGLRATIEPHHLHMRGVTAKGPGGTEVHLRGAKGAWVVPRRELDHAIVLAAQAAGATFVEDTKATELLRDASGQVHAVETTRGTFEADLVVCANGSPSRFETDQTPREGIRTIMGWWKGARLARPDEGVFVWDERLDGYYAWLFPEPGGVVNVGLTIPEHATHVDHLKALFHELLDQYFGDTLRGADELGKEMGHPATVTTRVGPIAEARALWCGEAARLVSPGSMEGIGFALESGMVAARVLGGLDPAKGLTSLQRARYRGSVGVRMLPKFWAGEAFVRLMRSPSALGIAKRFANPQWLSERAAAMVGESQH